MNETEEFDKFANNYDAVLDKELSITGADGSYFLEYKVKEVLEYEGNRPIKLLDFGCSTGRSADCFEKYFSQMEYHGVDCSSESIKVAQDRNIQGADFIVANGESLPFENDFFDVIYCANTFHHIIEDSLKDKILRELYRVLKPGGSLYFFECNPLNLGAQIIMKLCPFDRNAKMITPFFMQKCLQKAGFCVLFMKGLFYFPRFKVFSVFTSLENTLKKYPLGAQYFIRAKKEK